MFEVKAQEWDNLNPRAGVSQFACRFPGQYREAADALRKIRQQLGAETGTPATPPPLAPARPIEVAGEAEPDLFDISDDSDLI